MLRQSARTAVRAIPQARFASTHAVSNASIVEIEKRWEDLPAADQQEIVSALSARQQGPWAELTLAEKKAAWYISYGSWGPRRPVHPKGEVGKIATGVFAGLGISLAIFFVIRANAPAPPKTMTHEWQEQSDEYLKSKNANPWSSYSQIQGK